MSVTISQCFGSRPSRDGRQPLQSRADQNTQPRASAEAHPKAASPRRQAVKAKPVKKTPPASKAASKAVSKPVAKATKATKKVVKAAVTVKPKVQAKAVVKASVTSAPKGKAKPKTVAQPTLKPTPKPTAKALAKPKAKPAVKVKAAAKPAVKKPSKPAAKQVGKSAGKPAVKAKPAVKKLIAKPTSKPTTTTSAKKPASKTLAKPVVVEKKLAKAAPKPTVKATAKAAKPAKPVKPAKVLPEKMLPKGTKSALPAATVAAPPAAPKPPIAAQSNGLPPPPPLKPGRRSSSRALAHMPPPAPMVPTHAPDAAKASYSTMTERVIAPPPHVAAKKDPKLANNWKTKTAHTLTDDEVKAMPDAEYMNDMQMAFFRHKLSILKQDIHNSAGATTEHLREDTTVVPDPADRATIEEEHALELRTRDRERKLLKKIEQSIARIDSGDYGYCDETGEPIGVGRLIARPTASLSLEAQQRRELKQKMFGD